LQLKHAIDLNTLIELNKPGNPVSVNPRVKIDLNLDEVSDAEISTVIEEPVTVFIPKTKQIEN